MSQEEAEFRSETELAPDLGSDLNKSEEFPSNSEVPILGTEAVDIGVSDLEESEQADHSLQDHTYARQMCGPEEIEPMLVDDDNTDESGRRPRLILKQNISNGIII